jgi:hypothetical protein
MNPCATVETLGTARAAPKCLASRTPRTLKGQGGVSWWQGPLPDNYPTAE